ncbi:MAG: RrF2 family transcriptional regulator [Gemmatimonadaceae bacterium]|nr:RrF2 family transcriptional regulator [Gemmatimonadaceae bacterium]
MPLSSTTQYALRAVLYVAEHGTNYPVPVDAIAADLRVPRNYLSKTLHALARAGVLTSGRGPRGGFRLARAARDLTLGDVAAPFDDVEESKCILGRTSCGWKNPCSAHPRWEAISHAQREFFRRTTIADLLGEIAEQPAMAPRHDLALHEHRVPTRGPTPGVPAASRAGAKKAAARSSPSKTTPSKQSPAARASAKQAAVKQSPATRTRRG